MTASYLTTFWITWGAARTSRIDPRNTSVDVTELSRNQLAAIRSDADRSARITELEQKLTSASGTAVGAAPARESEGRSPGDAPTAFDATSADHPVPIPIRHRS